MPGLSEDPLNRRLIDEISDKRAYEEELCEALCGLLRRRIVLGEGLFPCGDHIVELRGEFPDTVLAVSGPGLKTHRPMHWDFEIWGDDFDCPAFNQAFLIMTGGMAD